MPRVPEGHAAKRRQEILAGARRVCETKPVYNVTMKEIVQESGMSQGGVYKYFANIDAVFAAMLNEAAAGSRVEADVQAILGNGELPWQQLTDLLQYLGRYIRSTVETGGRIYFELMMLYANEPARFLQIRDQLVEVSALESLQAQVTAFIKAGVAEGVFAPTVPLDDLFLFLMTSIHGMTQALITAGRLPAVGPVPDVERLMAVLAVAVRGLLGGA